MTRYQADLLPRLLWALIQTRSVNLKQVAAAVWGSATPASCYRRLQRFLSGRWSPQVGTQLIVQRVVKPGTPVLLTLDRTHWQYGQTHHNLLCLGVVYQRVSIPIESGSLGRAGNSTMADQINLLNRALAYLPAGRCCLLADREFIGGTWLRHLQKQQVDFVIRVRANYTIERADGTVRSLACTTRGQAPNTTCVYEHVHLYEGSNTVPVHIICHRPLQGARIFLATHRTDFDAVVSLYKQRWAAETAFGFLKSKGFDLETTHLRDPERIRRLLSVLTIAMLWGLRVGAHLHQHQTTPIKKHGALAQSRFRRGLDYIQHLIANRQQKKKTILHMIRLLVSCS